MNTYIATKDTTTTTTTTTTIAAAAAATTASHLCPTQPAPPLCTCRSSPRRLSSTQAQAQSARKHVSSRVQDTSKDKAHVPLPTFLDVFNCFTDDAYSHVVQRHKLAPLRTWNTTEKGFNKKRYSRSIVAS
jgi:hypothetical protein